MPDLNRPRLYLIRNPFDPTFQPRLIESKRIEQVRALAPLGAIVKRAADRELHALAQAGVRIEALK